MEFNGYCTENMISNVDWLVEVEAACRGSDADMALLHSHHVQVHEVTVHLPVSRWRVPAAHGQDLQALHRLLEVIKPLANGKNLTIQRETFSFPLAFPVNALQVFVCIYFSHLPVLVLWLERHQGALFAAGQDVLWGGTVNLLQLVALFLPLTTICGRIRTSKVNACSPTCMSPHSCITQHITMHAPDGWTYLRRTQAVHPS